MPVERTNPYGAFNYLVSLNDKNNDPTDVFGGFSDVSGLGMEVSYSDYRNGNEKFNTARKIPNTHKLDDVTLKRGLVGSTKLYEWLKAVADGAYAPTNITITLLDEARQTVATWVLRNAQPKKWVGPTLAAKGGGEVAMEELHLVHEGIDYK
ncbi:MAG TPA: phage tail protein [Blastocatellia bacterium]|nr:phage tail protein [Blastocatellia bacterium]